MPDQSGRASVSVHQLLAIALHRMGQTEMVITEADIHRHATERVQITSRAEDPKLPVGAYRVERTQPPPAGITVAGAEALDRLPKPKH